MCSLYCFSCGLWWNPCRDFMTILPPLERSNNHHTAVKLRDLINLSHGIITELMLCLLRTSKSPFIIKDASKQSYLNYCYCQQCGSNGVIECWTQGHSDWAGGRRVTSQPWQENPRQGLLMQARGAGPWECQGHSANILREQQLQCDCFWNFRGIFSKQGSFEGEK